MVGVRRRSDFHVRRVRMVNRMGLGGGVVPLDVGRDFMGLVLSPNTVADGV